MQSRALSLIFVLLCVLFLTPFGLAQMRQSIPPGLHPADEQEIRLQREQAKKLNQQRQQSLKRDTDKLLELTTELKDYVDKSNENLLSMDVIKKAEQIEKLARSVKEKMKGY